MAKILTVKGLGVVLDGRAIINDINLGLEAGDSLAIIGPNGSGKTMFLRTLLGMVPYTGSVEWAPNVSIGYVPQKIDADRHLPVNLKNLLHAKASILEIGRHDAEAKINSLIREVGLTEASLKSPIGHLSGGQFQRALIAFALLGHPNVLLLDEPTASIDLPGEEQVYELVHRLQDKYEMTTIMVSHDLSYVYRYATNVFCLNKSGICFGPPQEVLTPQVMEKLYGGHHKFFHHLHGDETRHEHEHHHE